MLKKYALIIAVTLALSIVAQSAYPVTIQKGPVFDNGKTRYVADSVFEASQINIDPTHIYLGGKYYDLTSVSGKVYANITSFNEGIDIRIKVLNGTLNDANFTLLGKAQIVQIDGVFYEFGDRWRYISNDTVTEVDVNNGMEVFVSFAIAPLNDLAIVQVRPVQAIFDADKLVDKRQALLRVVITNSFSQNVTAEVKLVFETIENGIPTNVTRFENVNLTSGLNVRYLPSGEFILPSGDRFTASVEVDPNNLMGESDEGNNSKAAKDSNGNDFIIKDTKPLRMLYRPILLLGDSSPSCTDGTNDEVGIFANGSSDFIKGTFPISEEEFSQIVHCRPFTPFPPIPGITTLSINDVVNIMEQLDIMTWFGQFDKVVGVVREGWFANKTEAGDIVGAASFPQFLVGNIDGVLVEKQWISGTVTAQEIAHSFGWVSGSPPGDLFDPAHMSNVPAPGYWVAQRRNITDLIDFMHPCFLCLEGDSPTAVRRWISKDTFDFILQQWKTNPDPNVIGISGFIFKNDTSTLNPWYRFNSTLDIPLNNTGGYTILYLDQSGAVIGQTGFDVSFKGLSHGGSDEVDFAPFALKIPDLNGTNRIVIKRQQQTVSERVISPNPPQVTVLSPNGGEVFSVGQNVTVQWQSSDPDGDSLSHVVSFSRDGGQTWIPLVVNLNDTQFSFKVFPNDISNSALIRVTATDGINTSEDTSDSTFAISSFNFKKGSFAKSTAAAPVSQNVTGLGFKPKAVILFTSAQSSEGFSDVYLSSIGFSDGTTSRSVAVRSDDGVATSNGATWGSSNIVTILRNPDIADAIATSVSFHNDGFSFTWQVNHNVSSIIHYIALGGSQLTNAKVGQFVQTFGGTGNQTISGVGFQPDFVMFMHHGSFAGVIPDAYMSIGFAMSPTKQASFAVASEDGRPSMDTWRYQRDDRAIVELVESSGAIDAEANLVSMDSDGFTINWVDAAANPDTVFYLALKGGNYDVGSFAHVQFARPDSDIVVGGWTTTPLYQNLDETPADDNDFVTSPTGTSPSFEVGLSNVSDPNSSSSHVLKFRGKATVGGGAAEQAGVELYQGSTLIASTGLQTMSRTSFTPVTYTLTAAQADSISDYNNLSVKITTSKGNSEQIVISWIEFEVPNPAAIQSITGVGFTPKGLILASVNNVASTSTASNNRLSFGAAHGQGDGNEGSVWFGDQDGVPDSITARSTLTTKIIRLATEAATGTSSTVNAEADLQSFDTDGFTLNWTTSDSVATQILYIVFG